MPKKRFSAERIVTLLRQIEVSMAQGNATPVACRDASISLQNYVTRSSTAKSSTTSRRPRSSSSNGASTTTRSDRTQRATIGRRRRRHSRPWLTT